MVRQIESLPVDANSRPLQDAKIVKCGELVRQVKGNMLFISYYTKIILNYYSQKREEEEKGGGREW